MNGMGESKPRLDDGEWEKPLRNLTLQRSLPLSPVVKKEVQLRNDTGLDGQAKTPPSTVTPLPLGQPIESSVHTSPVLASSEPKPIKKPALRADAPEWKGTFAYVPPTSGVSRTTSEGKFSRPLSAPSLPNDALDAEQRVKVLNETRSAWQLVRQKSVEADEELKTRRVWGTPGKVREKPWASLDQEQTIEVNDTNAFPALPLSKQPLVETAPSWPVVKKFSDLSSLSPPFIHADISSSSLPANDVDHAITSTMNNAVNVFSSMEQDHDLSTLMVTNKETSMPRDNNGNLIAESQPRDGLVSLDKNDGTTSDDSFTRQDDDFSSLLTLKEKKALSARKRIGDDRESSTTSVDTEDRGFDTYVVVKSHEEEDESPSRASASKPLESDEGHESPLREFTQATLVQESTASKPSLLNDEDDHVSPLKEFSAAILVQESSVVPSMAVDVEEEDEEEPPAVEEEPMFAMEEEPPPIVAPSTARRPRAGDFHVLHEIGTGSFGRVMLIERKKTKERLAMKILEKERIVARQNERYVMEERDILTRVDHPFIVSLHFAFQSKNKLFLVMEYLPGGELLQKIRKEGLLNDRQAMFYAGEMILALEYLHVRNIVHRDLKPENILLDRDGHIRLTDFGLARKLEGEDALLKSICGTDLYMAPEMLAGKAYGKAVDFWALGCIIYEMQTGDPPFDANNRRKLYQMIMTKNAKYPSWMSSSCNKLLKGLLDRNVEKRLGASKSTMFELGGIAALKQHEFFKKLDWQLLEKKQLVPPLTVEVNQVESLTREESLLDGGGSECSAEEFRGFSYVHPQFAFSPKLAKASASFFSSDHVVSPPPTMSFTDQILLPKSSMGES